MNIYVIGPVTGKEDENHMEFERVRDELWANPANNAVIIPHDHVVPGSSWEQAMQISITEMLRWWSFTLYPVIGHGFAVALLDGWEDSRGARIERDLAEALGIECRPWMEWL